MVLLVQYQSKYNKLYTYIRQLYIILLFIFILSRITGAMGKGLAVLTFDEDYQKKRRQNMNAKPKTFQEGMARSGKGLVMVIYLG